MKQKAKYSKRFLAVLLAMLMLLAAAQPVSFVAAAGNDPDPVFGEGAASAYWDGSTIRLEFPQATTNAEGGIQYYADVIDLDVIDPSEVHMRKVVAEGISLQSDLMTMAEGNTITAAIQSDALEGVDVSHRLDIAITAVNGSGWRSQPIHAVVGDSVRIPEAGSAPTEGANFKKFAFFTEDNIGDEEAEMRYHNNGDAWPAGQGPYEYGMNVDGARDNSGNDYRDAGYTDENSADKWGGATAYRFYITDPNKQNITADIHWNAYTASNPYPFNTDFRETDVGYRGWENTYNYTGATELWIWVDMSSVRFGKLSFQVRPNDGGVIEEENNDSTWGIKGEANDSRVVFGPYEYSTVNYYEQMGQEAEIKYVNSDGVWDTLTTEGGYLRNFGNYRGYLRIPVDQLVGLSYNGYYDEQNTNLNSLVENPALSRTGWKPLDEAQLRYVDWDPSGEPTYSRPALNYITSVGFTWSDATADSQDQPFYIDHIGFVGNMSGSNVSALPYTTDQQASFNALVQEKLPASSVINLSHQNLIEDLEAIASIAGLEKPAELTAARTQLDTLLSGDAVSNLPKYLSDQVNALGDSYTPEQIQPLYELYLTFTIDQLSQLGAAVEKKLLAAYNAAVVDEYFPDALANLAFTPFNDFETNYTVGDRSYDLYENTAANSSSMWQMSPNYNEEAVKNSWETTRKLMGYSYNNDEDVIDTRYTFGLGSTGIGNSGFMGSQSVNTRLNRGRAGSDGEKYRITFPYLGDESPWDSKPSCSLASATDFMFYVDFSDVKNIRKMWISLVGNDGYTYSHDFQTGNLTYQRLKAGTDNWESITVNDNDGCLMNEMAGFKGFIKIPLSYFWADTNIPTEAPDPNVRKLDTNAVEIKQIRIQYSADEAGSKANVGSHLIFDMFGFVGVGQTFKEQYYTPVDTAPFVASSVTDVQYAFNALYTTAQTIEGQTLTLLKSADADLAAITSALRAYYSLSMEDKEQITFPSYDGTINASLADILAVQANTETRMLNGASVAGNLATYVADANTQYRTVTDAFPTNGLNSEKKTAVTNALNTYDGYPAKYQNTVQTYWADRNLSAVFPNFTVKTDDIAENTQDTPLITMKLDDEAGTTYTGTGALPFYAAAAANPYDVRLEIPSTVTLSMDDEKITVPITGQVISPADPGTMNFSLSIAETDVQNSGVYTGSFNVTLETPVADRGTGQSSNPLGSGGVPDAEDYRMETYTVYVKLICEASYTVVIPADTTIEWFETSEVPVGEGVRVEDVRIPSNAAVQVDVDSDGEYALTKDGNKIPYLLNGGTSSLSHTFDASNFDAAFSLKVLVNSREDWLKVPAEEENYQDVLNFTVTYRENA